MSGDLSDTSARALVAWLQADSPRPRAPVPGVRLDPGARLRLEPALPPGPRRAVLEALAGARVVELSLRGARLTGDELAALAGSLRASATLTRLDLRAVELDARGLTTLLAALAETSRLRALWLGDNPLGAAGVRALVEYMSVQPCSIQQLGLGGVRLDHGGRAALLAALPGTLERLDISNTAAAPDDAALDELAALAGRLRVLGLAGLELGDRGAQRLAEHVQRSETIERLELSANDIGRSGASALATAAREHTTLRRLDLHDNPIGDGGARLLAAALPRCGALEHLGLRGCGLGPDGARALVEALTEPGALRRLELDPALTLPEEVQAAKVARLCRNRNLHAASPPSSLALTPDEARPRHAARPAPKADAPAPPDALDPDELAACQRVLAAVRDHPELLRAPGLAALRRALVEAARAGGLAGRVADQGEPGHENILTKRARDREARRGTGIQRQRDAMRDGSIPPSSEDDARRDAAPPTLERRRRCYICKRPYRQLHFFYDSLCPPCAALNFEKRCASADLRGRVALVTGGRVKIGLQLGLMLLRAGARVIVTTRFPRDALARYAQEPDFASHRERLHVHALDLRFTPLVERFADHVTRAYPRLDILINNAAQTVQRPPGFHAPLEALERAPPGELAPALRPLLAASFREPDAALALPGGEPRPARPELDARLFPPDSNDGHAQPLDLRIRNSWRLRVHEVATRELLEVQLINAIAPYLLVARLRDFMARAGGPADRFIVNVSAVEGQFTRAFKSDLHPHTNMAKAALNMLTRTSARDLARQRVYMTSVDTGWVTNENPHPLSARMADDGFSAPLDELDGAARVLDPVFTGIASGAPVFGVFFKDYAPAPW